MSQLPPTAAALDAQLASIVGADHVRPAGEADAVAGVRPRLVVEPRTAEESARVLRAAADAGAAVAPRGGGTKLDWGNPPRSADVVLSTRRLDAVLDHAAGDLTITLQGGCTIGRLQQVVAGAGQRLALDPAWPEQATVGGVVASNDSGALRGAFGSLRDQLLGIQVALVDGRLARAGGRVVKNVAGYDLPKLYCGSLGTLGVIVEATFRLYPLPRETRTLVSAPADAAAASALLLTVHASTLRPTGVQLALEAGRPAELAVRLESGSPAALDAQQTALAALAAGAEWRVADPKETWLARERLFQGDPSPAAVAKVTFLPARLGALAEAVAAAAPGPWRLLAHSAGIGWLRLQATSPEALRPAILRVRAEAALRGGSLSVAQAPIELAREVDAWGEVGDALPLMRRVKEQFDPRGILNPGRFVGGI